MDKLSKIYHKLFNQLNNICMISGIFRVELDSLNETGTSKKELNKRIDSWKKFLKDIDKNALAISDKLQKLSKISRPIGHKN